MKQAMDTPNKLQLQGAAKVLSHQKQKLKEGRHNWALRCKWRLSRVLQVGRDTQEMETDDEELPEDLLVDDVTMIAEAESSGHESS